MLHVTLVLLIISGYLEKSDVLSVLRPRCKPERRKIAYPLQNRHSLHTNRSKSRGPIKTSLAGALLFLRNFELCPAKDFRLSNTPVCKEKDPDPADIVSIGGQYVKLVGCSTQYVCE